MKTIDDRIHELYVKLTNLTARENKALMRHLHNELSLLWEYKRRHPEDQQDPNALELFIEANPSAGKYRDHKKLKYTISD